MNWDTFRHWFAAGSADLELIVAHATPADRQRLLDVLPAWGHAITPPGPGESAPHFMVGSATVTIEAPRGEALVLSLPTRPLYYDEAGYRAVEALVARVAHVLGRTVRLSRAASASDDWITTYDPMNGAFARREPASHAPTRPLDRIARTNRPRRGNSPTDRTVALHPPSTRAYPVGPRCRPSTTPTSTIPSPRS